MAIKKLGGPGRAVAPQPIESKKPATIEGFGKVAKAGPAQTSEPTEVAQAVNEVAADIAAGRLTDPQMQVDAVIDRMVRLQAPEGASTRAVNSRVSEVQLALGDHPGFSERIQAMLSNALAANEA